MIQSTLQSTSISCYGTKCELNGLHAALKQEREKTQMEEDTKQGIDAISFTQHSLQNWQVDGPVWVFSHALHPVIAQACPAGE